MVTVIVSQGLGLIKKGAVLRFAHGKLEVEGSDVAPWAEDKDNPTVFERVHPLTVGLIDGMADRVSGRRWRLVDHSGDLIMLEEMPV